MVGLLDIAEKFETVDVNGTPIQCYGVPVKKVAQLLMQFPEMKLLLAGAGSEITAEMFATFAPNAVASVIAIGTRDETAEAIEKAESLPLEFQFNLLAAIGKATAPGGVIPFLERMRQVNVEIDAFAERLAIQAQT